MTTAWRLWVLILVVLAALTTAFGMRVGLGTVWWPIAGLWLAAGFAAFGLSVWVAGCLIMLGLVMDYMGEAPIGSWPLALLCAYGVALIAWDRQPPIPVVGAEAIALIGGIIAVSRRRLVHRYRRQPRARLGGQHCRSSGLCAWSADG